MIRHHAQISSRDAADIVAGLVQGIADQVISNVRDSGGNQRCAWTRAALARYCDDGLLEIHNTAAERALRAVALGRKNYLFTGSDSGREGAAAIYSLIGSAKLNQLDSDAYLRHF